MARKKKPVPLYVDFGENADWLKALPEATVDREAGLAAIKELRKSAKRVKSKAVK